MLKLVFLYTVLTCYAVWALPQNNFQSIKRDSSRTIDPWDIKLEQYVWSHTHPISLKQDKPSMNFKEIENYVTIGEDADVSISPDGNYFTYGIKSYHGKRDSLVVQATTGTWRRIFSGSLTPGFFSNNSKQYVFQQNEDLCFLSIGASELHIVKGIFSLQQSLGQWLAYLKKNHELVVQSLQSGKEKRFEGVSDYQFDVTGQWVICRFKSELKQLLLYNLNSGKEYRFQSVDSYIIHKSGKYLLLHTKDNHFGSKLQYINLTDEATFTIWSNSEYTIKITSYVLDGSGAQVAFTKQDSLDVSKSSIWYWKAGMDKAILKVDRQTEGMPASWIVQDANFTDNDQYILFSATQQQYEYPKPNPNAINMDVWSYKDTLIQSSQKYILTHQHLKKYNGVISTDGSRVIGIVKNYHEWIKVFLFPKGNFTVIEKSGKPTDPNEPNFAGDRFWEEEYQADSTWLVSLKDGSRRLLKSSGSYSDIWFSPQGKYLVYFDSEKQCNYFSIDLTTGKLTNISSAIPAYQLGRRNYYLRNNKKPQYNVGIAGWLQGDSGLLVYDNYDIWQLDLSGKKTAVNITNGYGRSNHIRFALTANGQEGQYVAMAKGVPVLPKITHLLLNSFDMKSKHSGVYKKILGVAGNPELLWTGPYILEKVPASTFDLQYLHSNGINLIKAANANVWIVKRQSTHDAPNYFLTSDFKNYKRLTDIQPHKQYSWLTAELHTFKQLDGMISQGILYKPENFDPSKKYPVLIVFYDTYTDALFKFPKPDVNWSATAPGVSPIMFLNNGYLIFTPDMYVSPLKYGPTASNVIEGAAKYLKQLQYVDSNHLGGAAHSWSAKLGAYIFTHSRTFSAIAISEGFVYGNLVNMALTIKEEDGRSNLETVEENFQYGNLWENKSSWLDQTTVLNVDRGSSPLLLYCGNKSSKDYQDQTVQFFSALRRLEKKVWWLQYETGRHTLFGADAKDYTIRYMQFFDHYLKKAPAPRWMTQGIRAIMKGIESGNDLDPTGNCGLKENKCKICNKWNGKYKKTPEMFTQPISEWRLDEEKVQAKSQ